MSEADHRDRSSFSEAETRPARGRDSGGDWSADRSLLEPLEDSAELDGPEPFVDAPPPRLGPYRVLREIGRGGMAVVFEGEQENPRRRVALKVLLAHRASQDTLRRFELEGLALARLEHPGIARIYEASEWHDGATLWPFLAMEYIEGPRLDAYADEAGLDLRGRLSLMAEVCDAVQHAHRNGIIHRDLKPANILVGPKGPDARPRVLDFGIARLRGLDDAAIQETRADQVLGTLQYMSPEQMRGSKEIDTRTDVYALGSILYLLLAGRPAYDLQGKGLMEIAHQIERLDPPLLGTLDPSLRGDVERIVARALEKDKALRYESAADLAEDLRRFLRHEPVLATPPTWRYQLGKLARRRRGLVAGGAAGLMALVVGGALATYGFVEARRERDAKQEALQEEAAARQTAEAVTGFLRDLIGEARPGRGGRQVTLREVLDRSSGEIDTRFAERPRVQAELHATMVRTYIDLGDYQAALPHAEAGLAVLKATQGPQAEATLTAMTLLGEVRYFTGDREGSLEVCREVLAIRESEGGLSAALVEAHGNVGFLLTRLDRPEPALEHLERASALAERLDAPDPKIVADLRTNLGSLYVFLDRGPEATAIYERLVAGSLAEHGADHPRTLLARANLATGYMTEQRFEKARGLLKDVLQAQRRVLGPSHSKTLISQFNLGNVHSELGAHDAAEALYREGLALAEDAYGPDSPSASMLRHGLYKGLVVAGKWAEAERLIGGALETYRRTSGDDDGRTRTLVPLLLEAEARQGRVSPERLAEVRAIGEAQLDPDELMNFQAVVRVAHALDAAGQRDEARGYLDRAAKLDVKAGRLKLDRAIRDLAAEP